MKKAIITALSLILFLGGVYYVKAADPFSLAHNKPVNKFEGYPMILSAPDNHIQGVSGVRFASSLNNITITDLDPSTRFNPIACDGSGTTVQSITRTVATVVQNPSTNKYCFILEDSAVQMSFQGDQYSGRVTYNTIANPPTAEDGIYNVRDFGAAGDGVTDDTYAIRGALAFAASRNGGTVKFPNGDYPIGGVENNFRGIALPSGVIVEGISSSYTGAPTLGSSVIGRGASRITLRAIDQTASVPEGNSRPTGWAGRAIFQIGEQTERVHVRDIELYVAPNIPKTYGIESLGAYNSNQDIFIERVVFNNFARGIYAHTLWDIHDNFQSDFWKVSQSRFVFNQDAGIYVDVWNTDWLLENNYFMMPLQKPGVAADGFKAIRVGMVTINSTSGGYPGVRSETNHGGDLIDIFETGNLVVTNSQSEASARNLVIGEDQGWGIGGNLSYPITLIGNIFGDGVEIKARRVVASTGNTYGASTWRNTHPLVQINSTGDRFCYDGQILGCQDTGNPSWGGGSVIFDTGQPLDTPVPERPPIIPTAGFPRGNQAPINTGPKTLPVNLNPGLTDTVR